MKYLNALLDGTWKGEEKSSDTKRNEPSKQAKPTKRGVLKVLGVGFPKNTRRNKEQGQYSKTPDGLAEGCLIEWKSPILGLLSGRVEMIPGDGSILVDHPLNDGTFGPAFIQTDWVTRIID